MQQRRIDATERLKVRRLLSYAFPFFIVPIMTLLAVFRPNENLLYFRDPIGCRLSPPAFCAMARYGTEHSQRRQNTRNEADGNTLATRA